MWFLFFFFYFKSVLAVIPSRLKLDVFLLHYLLHSSFSLLLPALLLHLLKLSLLSSALALLFCPWFTEIRDQQC